jgi:hypothetical protein
MITAEIQKGHTYYRCTKKSKAQKCNQPFIREEELDRQLSEMIQKVSLSQYGADQMLGMLEQDKNNSAESCVAFVQERKKKIEEINQKLQKLLDGYLEQDVEKEIYRVEKSKFMSEKKTLEDQIIRAEQKQFDRLEPMRAWINLALNTTKIAKENDLNAKRVLAKKIFGSNLTLMTKKAHSQAQKPWSLLSKTERSSFFVTVYNQARTFFDNEF